MKGEDVSSGILLGSFSKAKAKAKSGEKFWQQFTF